MDMIRKNINKTLLPVSYTVGQFLCEIKVERKTTVENLRSLIFRQL
jgi:hypothetical protein